MKGLGKYLQSQSIDITPGSVCVKVNTGGDDSGPSASHKTIPERTSNTTIPSVGTLEPYARNLQSGLKRCHSLVWWSVVVDTCIILMGFAVFMVSAFAADDSYNVNSNEEIRFPLTLATFVIAFAVWLLLTVFLYCNRKEPEIQSQNYYFRTQILVCGGLSIFCKFVAFLMQYKYSQVNHYARIIVIGVAYYGVLSAILLKLHFIYTICVKQELRQSYSTGFLYHIPLITISVVPLYACSFASVSCSQGAVWSGSWCMLAFFMLEFGFYLWNVRPVPELFVDFGSNIRVFCFISITYLGSTYTLVEGRPLYVYDLSYIVFPFALYVAWFEIFGLIVIKIARRRCGTQWLKDENLQGIAGAFLQTRDGTMDFVLFRYIHAPEIQGIDTEKAMRRDFGCPDWM